MIVRAADRADLDGILAIAGECPEAPQWPGTAWTAYLSPAPDGSGPLRAALVAAEGGEILGFAAATLLLDGEENRCELESIAVHPAARKRGIGGALFEAVFAWAEQNGGRQLALEVRAGNAVALGFYARMGLRITGRRSRYYADPEEDALLLEMPVTEASKRAVISTGKLVEGGRPGC